MILDDVLMHLYNARKILIAMGTLARASVALFVFLFHVGAQVGGLSKPKRIETPPIQLLNIG